MSDRASTRAELLEDSAVDWAELSAVDLAELSASDLIATETDDSAAPSPEDSVEALAQAPAVERGDDPDASADHVGPIPESVATKDQAGLDAAFLTEAGRRLEERRLGLEGWLSVGADAEAQQELARVHEALGRIASGTYGRCVRCDAHRTRSEVEADVTSIACGLCREGEQEIPLLPDDLAPVCGLPQRVLRSRLVEYGPSFPVLAPEGESISPAESARLIYVDELAW